MHAARIGLAISAFTACFIQAQTNPLWHEQKIKNYLPHMTWPEVRESCSTTSRSPVRWSPRCRKRSRSPAR